jgi:hypothetical protein
MNMSSSVSKICRLVCFIATVIFHSESASNSISSPRRFLIEFRGVQPFLRVDEFLDASAAVLGGRQQKIDRMRSSIEVVIPDPLSPRYDPICAYFDFPGDVHEVLRLILPNTNTNTDTNTNNTNTDS